MATRIGNISELQKFLQTIEVQDEKKPDEFTAREIWEGLKTMGDKRSYNAVRLHLENEEREGRYSRRQIVINGKRTYVYRRETTTQRSNT